MPYDENGEWYYDEGVDETDYGGDTNPDNPGVGSGAYPYSPYDVNFDDEVSVSGNAPDEGDGMAYDSPQPIDWEGGGGGGRFRSVLRTITGDRNSSARSDVFRAGLLDMLGGTLNNLTAQPHFQKRRPFEPGSDMAGLGDRLRNRPDVDLSGIQAQNPMGGMGEDHIVNLLKGLK